MASKTRATELKRLRRDAAGGKKRKAANRNKGTTPTKAKLFGDKEA